MRLFIGVEVGAEVREALDGVLARLKRRSPDSKWVAPEKAHLTLAFLGAVDEETVPALDEALGAAVARQPPFSLEYRGGGSFGGKARPRVLWVDVQGDLEQLAAVQSAVAAAVRELGFTLEERPYVAHLTLARARHPRGDAGLAECAEKLQGQVLGKSRVAEVVLFQSHTSSKGSTYEILKRWPLSSSR